MAPAGRMDADALPNHALYQLSYTREWDYYSGWEGEMQGAGRKNNPRWGFRGAAGAGIMAATT